MAYAGSVHGETCAVLSLGIVLFGLGEFSAAEASYRRAIELGGPVFLKQYAELALAMIHTHFGRTTEAIGLLEPLHSSLNADIVQLARCATAAAYNTEREYAKAMGVAQSALECRGVARRRYARILLCSSLLGIGRFTEALAESGRALEELGLMQPEGEVLLGILRALAFRALERGEEACTTIRAARDLVHRVAGGLEDPGLRHSFLTNLEWNRKALGIARDWLGEDDADV
jgi:tetratricopeptide (TPR) repeat protein